jgi:PAS domain S-box-containing protein
MWAFIPFYQAALAVSDVVTATLLVVQFMILRTRRLLALTCAYIFTAAMVIAHTLSFPGLFTPTGLLGAGPQSTAWLYMFWHAGFPLLVIAYALLSDEDGRQPRSRRMAHRELLAAVAGTLSVAVVMVLWATAGQHTLPAIMQGNEYTPAMKVVIGFTWLLTFVSLPLLWLRTRHTILDVWLMVVMCAWIFDIGLSAVFNAGRFDLGFYAGRIYGILAASFVLVVLLIGTANLYRRFARLLDVEQQQRRRETQLRRRIFDTSLDLLLVTDRRGQLIEVSPSSENTLGYRPHEMIGHGGRRFVHPEDLDKTRSEMRAARLGGAIRNFDCRYVHKDGRAVPLT